MTSPCAQTMPGTSGTRTVRIPRASATSRAWSGPAPPNATRVKSRGSCPRSTEMVRIVRTMLATTTPITPCAARSTPYPSSSAMSENAPSARARSRVIRPPRSPRPESLPSSRLASVTVGAVPPRP